MSSVIWDDGKFLEVVMAVTDIVNVLNATEMYT